MLPTLATSVQQPSSEVVATKDTDPGPSSLTVEVFANSQSGVDTEKIWNKALLKCDRLMRMMKTDNHGAGHLFNPPRESAESDFTTSIVLSDEGYAANFDAPRATIHSHYFLKKLGVCHRSDARGGYNQLEEWRYVGTDNDDPEDPYLAAGWFDNFVNPKDGVLIAAANYSAEGMAKYSAEEMAEAQDVQDLPGLRHWSDVAFLQWLKIKSVYRMRHGKSGVSLRYIIRESIENEDTVALVNCALKGLNKGLNYWPGVEIAAESAQGMAILGSPNGAGVGFLIAQHKNQLGHKIVHKIRVFGVRRYSGPDELALLFIIKDVEQTAQTVCDGSCKEKTGQ